MEIETLRWKQEMVERVFLREISFSLSYLAEEEFHIMEITPSTHSLYILPLGFLILIIYLHWFYQACITETSI